MRRRAVLMAGGAALAAAAVALPVRTSYRIAMDAAWARLQGRSRTIPSRAGTLEYAEAGQGPPLLILHGTGGGFDQGLSFGRRLSEAGWRVIAPSRFGYLGSAFPEDASSEAQADALIDLLDALGIDRLPVIGGSAGALPAIAFALRHPDRCAALVAVVPATYVPGRPPVELTATQTAIIRYALHSDFLFWAGTAMAEDAMIRTLLATDPALVHAAAPAEQARVRTVLTDILPVGARARGTLRDGLLAGNPKPMDLRRITAPTLAISLEDDLFGTSAAAQHIAAEVPGAKLITYPTGGHIWVGRDAELMAAIDGFLRAR